MSATTLYAEPAIPTRNKRASLRRLTLIELRKMADTRAGIALLGITVLIAVVVMIVLPFTAHSGEQTYSYFFRNTLPAMGALLPVLGILAATSEWSQRTALSTFTLVPHRERVTAAKALAVVLLAVIATAVCLVTAALANSIAVARGGNGSWDIAASTIGNGLLSEVIGMLMGFAFGLLLMSSPIAIVAHFLVPTIIQLVGGLVNSLTNPLHWIDLSAVDKLNNEHLSSGDWARIGTTVALWLIAPLVIGMFRLSRHEVK
jgi:ABC-type transport system involved in multi-copper enzyme maturation permease subunit